jgi:hypothetical protein
MSRFDDLTATATALAVFGVSYGVLYTMLSGARSASSADTSKRAGGGRRNGRPCRARLRKSSSGALGPSPR